MIITIDGPAGSGKSTAARALAERLGFHFLDTGAMYRAVTLAAVRQGLPWDRPQELIALAGRVRIELDGKRVLLDGNDVTQEIRTPEITAATHHAADNPGVRQVLVELQRRAAEGHDVVTEGRDQGTVVFPHAECKIYLTASETERARRRQQDILQRGHDLPYERVLEDQRVRDDRDSSRSVGPLVKADDAVELSTDGLDAGQVVDQLEQLVREKIALKRR